MTEVEEGT
jgi:hypothetical protein